MKKYLGNAFALRRQMFSLKYLHKSPFVPKLLYPKCDQPVSTNKTEKATDTTPKYSIKSYSQHA